MFFTERERKANCAAVTRSLKRVSLYHEKCLPEVVQKKIHPKVVSKGHIHHLSKQNDRDKVNSSLVLRDTGPCVYNGIHLPPLKSDKILVAVTKKPTCNEQYFVPILIPATEASRPTRKPALASGIVYSSISNCCKDNIVLPVKPKPHRLVPLIRQKALEDNSNFEVSKCVEKPRSYSPDTSIANNNNCVKKPLKLGNKKETSPKPKKSLPGEFTHFPSFWKIYPAKPSPTILPPLAGFFQSIPNLSPRRTNKMATSPTLDQSVPNMITPSVLISHDLLTNGDEDSQEGLSPVLLPTIVSRPPFVHTVSIVVEPVTDAMCDGSSMDEPDTDEFSSTEIDDDLVAGKSIPNEDLVKTVMDHARLRKEEFARLLEEHAQIVSEINRAENKMV